MSLQILPQIRGRLLNAITLAGQLSKNTQTLYDHIDRWPNDLQTAHRDLESAAEKIQNLIVEIETMRILLGENNAANKTLTASLAGTAHVAENVEWIIRQKPYMLVTLIERLGPEVKDAILGMLLNSDSSLLGNDKAYYGVMERSTQDVEGSKDNPHGQVPELPRPKRDGGDYDEGR